MTSLSRIAALLTRPGPSTADCAPCRHFDRAPDRIEAAMPGLSALASAQASTFNGNGLCNLHDRIINGRARCSGFCDQVAPDTSPRPD